MTGTKDDDDIQLWGKRYLRSVGAILARPDKHIKTIYDSMLFMALYSCEKSNARNQIQ